jgi:uncharacterized integral membrane protein
MRRFAWIVTLPVSVIVIVFAVMNRQPVELDVWPLPWNVSAPLFLLTLGLVLFGFLLGVVVMWFTGGKQRRRLRALKRELDDARIDLHEMRQTPRPGAGSSGTAVAVRQNRLPAA